MIAAKPSRLPDKALILRVKAAMLSAYNHYKKHPQLEPLYLDMRYLAKQRNPKDIAPTLWRRVVEEATDLYRKDPVGCIQLWKKEVTASQSNTQ